MIWSEFGPFFGGFFHPQLEAHSQLPGNVWTEYWNRTPNKREVHFGVNESFPLVSQQYSYIFIFVWTSWSTTGDSPTSTCSFSKEFLQQKHVWSFLCLCAFIQVYAGMRSVMHKISFINLQAISEVFTKKKKPTCTIHVRSASKWNVPKEMMLWSGIYCPPTMMAPKPPPSLKK